MSKKPDGQGKSNGGVKKENVVKIARTASNKAKAVARHLKDHPNDTTKHGQVVQFPVRRELPDKTKPTMMHDVDGFFNKKTKVIELPKIMYVVVASKLVVVESTAIFSDAEKAFKETNCHVDLFRVVEGKAVHLESKKARPLMTAKEKVEAAFGEQKGKQNEGK